MRLVFARYVRYGDVEQIPIVELPDGTITHQPNLPVWVIRLKAQFPVPCPYECPPVPWEQFVFNAQTGRAVVLDEYDSSKGALRRTSLQPDGGAPTIMLPHGWRVYHLNSSAGTFSLPPAFLSNRSIPLSTPLGCMKGEPVRQCAGWIPHNLVVPHTGLADCAPRNTVTVCAPWLIRLAPMQALISWQQVGGLPRSRPATGIRLVVAGHVARLRVRKGRQKGQALYCGATGATSGETIVGYIYYHPRYTEKIPRYSNWYEMDACLRGPDLVRLHRQVLAVFRSIRGIP